MLFKSLEFKNVDGQKVKIIEIPVLEDDNPYQFMVKVRLQTFIAQVYASKKTKKVHSFKDYLKRVLKWPVYEQIFKSEILKNNA
ncbi:MULTISPECIES: YpmP family protein [Anoxybacillus]|uniref:DUF2535 family protein n=1 Tax=Anoxybacillus flavithermus TaxID=33934 RepID=A0A178T4X7_9BACL|nr:MULTISPECIES: YpmP family protein [Anoxybacillus]MCG6196957.1 YpmP family protein [Anoxybacillus sp. LAT_38]ASA95964.1 hypothetical protein CA592_03435 [Anoxybacillus flavithermus]ELK21930.1 hypothetical protein AF6_1404 [Anoxybacillus flavithermus TNO-09.006]MBE2905275.1 YpmP family protein [Anoxybacillus flavithermus]MBE2908234.1 YpmP family protein [Anoxybacillus flavithermus]